jgi:hypothetical protein
MHPHLCWITALGLPAPGGFPCNMQYLYFHCVAVRCLGVHTQSTSQIEVEQTESWAFSDFICFIGFDFYC